MKIKSILILIMTITVMISQPSQASDPCADEWTEYQSALADAGGNFRDPTVQIAIRALRVCRLNNGH
jgi:hypothetical protein